MEGTCPHCGYPVSESHSTPTYKSSSFHTLCITDIRPQDARGDQCDSCSKTLDSAALLINPRCIISGTHNVTTRSTSHMYIRLDAIQPQLVVQLRDAAKKGNWTGNAVISKDGEIIDWRMKAGLKPSPITRDLKWGVPVPTPEGEDDGMNGKVFYVWVRMVFHVSPQTKLIYFCQYDAPIGYPSITANFTQEWKQWWFNPQNVKLYQFMGKDNVYFHTVLWPACLLGDGRPWTRLFYISATGKRSIDHPEYKLTSHKNSSTMKVASSQSRGIVVCSAPKLKRRAYRQTYGGTICLQIDLKLEIPCSPGQNL